MSRSPVRSVACTNESNEIYGAPSLGSMFQLITPSQLAAKDRRLVDAAGTR